MYDLWTSGNFCNRLNWEVFSAGMWTSVTPIDYNDKNKSTSFSSLGFSKLSETFRFDECSFVSAGIFKAPAAGYYSFSFFYQADKSRKSGLRLMKNSEVIVKTYDGNHQGPNFTDNGGNTACLQLQAGDKVFVRLLATCHVKASDSVTTFSGFLLSEI